MLLVTGATGFIGNALVSQLLVKHKVRCIVRDKNRLLLKHKNLEVVEGSFVDLSLLEKAMRNVTCVVHVAAIIDSADKSIYTINVVGTKHLVEAAKKAKVKKFIFISSENVYFNHKDTYTRTKQEAEGIVKQFEKHVILREPIVYGLGDKKYVGKLIRLIKHNKIVPIPGSGKYLVQPLHVDDLVVYIQKAIVLPIYGTYMLAGKNSLSYNQLYDLLIRELSLKRIKLHVPLPFLKLVALVLQSLGIKPPLTYAQLCNLARDRNHSIKEVERRFKHTPLTFLEGIRRTIKQEPL